MFNGNSFFDFLVGILKRKVSKVFGFTSAGNQISEGSWPTWDKYFLSSESMKNLWDKPTKRTKKLMVEFLEATMENISHL